jgi:hypothetical protein
MLQWLCDWLNKVVYGIDVKNPPKLVEKVVYIARYDVDASLIIPGDIKEAMGINKQTLLSMNSVFSNGTFRTYLAVKRDLLVNAMVSDGGGKSERIKGAIETVDSVFGDLNRYAEAHRINAGVK